MHDLCEDILTSDVRAMAFSSWKTGRSLPELSHQLLEHDSPTTDNQPTEQRECQDEPSSTQNEDKPSGLAGSAQQVSEDASQHDYIAKDQTETAESPATTDADKEYTTEETVGVASTLEVFQWLVERRIDY